MHVKKLILYGTFILANVASILLLVSKFNTYGTEFIVFPKSYFDSLKYASIVNSQEFKNKFASTLPLESHDQFKLNARVLKNDLLIIKMTSPDLSLLRTLKTDAVKYIENDIESSGIKSENTEIKFFIINDLVQLFKNKLNTFNDEEKVYLDKLGDSGTYLKEIIKIQALLYLDSRINNIDISTILTEIDTLKNFIVDNSSKKDFKAYNQNINQSLLKRSVEYYFAASLIDSAFERRASIERVVNAKFKILNFSSPDRELTNDEFILNLLLLNTALILIYFFMSSIQLKKKDNL